MAWLIGLALVLLLIGGGTRVFRGRGKSVDRDTLTMRRVEAYMETIRRERPNAELAAMSDTELRDLLDAGARNFRIAGERRVWILFGCAGLTVVAASFASLSHGLGGAAACVAIGACVTYGLNVYLLRQAREPLEKRGLDVDRLIVE